MSGGPLLGARRAAVAWTLACALAPAAMSQTRAERLAAFDDLAAQFADAAPDLRGELAAKLSAAFLRLEDGDGRDARRALGAVATLAAGRVELALRLSAAGADGYADERLLEVHLRALLQEGRLVEWTRLDEAQRTRWAGACDRALVAEEARLLPAAAAALRGPDRPAGRRAFERLARVEPVQAYRLANLGLCLRQIGDLGAAEAVYERAREVAPDDLQMWNDYGLLLRARGARAAALDAFWESVRLDWARGPALRGKGPAITNLVHMEALGVGASPAAGAGAAGQDPVPLGREALAQRPDATMLRRLMLDVELDRRTTGASTGRAGADAARVNTLRNRR